MNSETIVMCVVALILGMLLAHMLKDVCGCKTVEGRETACGEDWNVCGPTGNDCCEEYECIPGGPGSVIDGGPPACAPAGTGDDLGLLKAFIKSKPSVWWWFESDNDN